MHRVVALALADVVAFDLAIPAQIFGHRDEANRYSFVVCSPDGGAVHTTTGFTIEATADLGALASADTVIVPGFWPLEDPPAPVLAALRAASARRARMASVCIGAFALAAAGLLDGRSATTHWEHAPEFRRRFPEVELEPDVLYVDDGFVLTSAGVSSGIDLCLHLYRCDHGASAAAEVARRMVAPIHRPGGQAQYIPRPLPKTGKGLGSTYAWAIENLQQPLGVDDLARHAHLARRTFTRVFRDETGMTPMQWLTAQRLIEARRLLESTDLTIDEVAHRSGLGSAVNLRTHLARDAGTTPSAYRNAFRSPPPSARGPGA